MAGITIYEGSSDSGTSSSEFGAALAVNKLYIHVAAPRYDTNSLQDAGAIYGRDPKDASPVNSVGYILDTANARAGSGLASFGTEVLIGVPGYSFGSGFVNYNNPKTNTNETLDNPVPGLGDNFGHALAINKKLIIIGAPFDAGGAGPERSGSAFVRRKGEPDLIRLTLPSYDDNDEAGFAVAVSNAYIAVGAPGTMVSGTSNAGVVHIYDAKTLVYLTTLSTLSFLDSPRFGSALAFSGKYLFVGAPDRNYGNILLPDYVSNAGAVLQYDTRTWEHVHSYYDPVAPQQSAAFGSALSADRKLLLVGAPLHDTANGTDAGKAVRFLIKTQTAINNLVLPEVTAGEEFGRAVLVLKGKRVLIGAPDPDSTTDEGRVFLIDFKP